jgi:hypothetical protein
MTTFTTNDREEAYKKILDEAPNQPGYEDAVPIPFAGWVNASPPHIVDSGASVNALERSLAGEITEGLEALKRIRQLEAELTEAGHMIGVLREYISDLEDGLDSSIKLNKAQALRKAQEK